MSAMVVVLIVPNLIILCSADVIEFTVGYRCFGHSVEVFGFQILADDTVKAILILGDNAGAKEE